MYIHMNKHEAHEKHDTHEKHVKYKHNGIMITQFIHLQL